jgi:membrane-bound lytic murein transglycosylase D
MSEDHLREVNLIPPRMLVKVGSTLLVPRAEHTTADVAEHIADNAALALSPEGRPPRTLTFKAGRQGDSVAAVARRYRVSAAQVAQWNGVTAQARFRAGQSITVQVPAKASAPPKSAKARAASRPAKAAPARKRHVTRARSKQP